MNENNIETKQGTEKKRPRIDTFPKLVLILVELHAMACITASYVLAFINHTTVENLSITIVGQIVVPLVAYILGNTVSNALEKNAFTFSTPLAAIESGLISSPNSDYSTAGTIDNPLDLDDLSDDTDISFEFGGVSGKGDD